MKPLHPFALLLIPLCFHQSAFADGTTQSLLKDLKSIDTETRVYAAKGIWRLPPSDHTSRDVIVPLCEALKDKDDRVRRFVATALAEHVGHVKALPKQLLPTLIPGMKDRNPNVRRKCTEAVVRLSYKHPIITPTLIKLLNGKDDDLRAQAALAFHLLALSGNRPKEAVPGLIAALKSRSEEARKWSAFALANIVPALKPPAVELIPALIRGLRAPDENVRVGCTAALAHLEHPAVVAALLEQMRGKDAHLRGQAVRVLARIPTKRMSRHPEVVPALIGTLEHKDPEARRAAAHTCANLVLLLKAPPKELLPALLKGLQDPDSGVQGACRNALAYLQDSRVVPELRKLLRGKGTQLQAAAAGTLQFMAASGQMATTGKRVPEAVPDLELLLRSPDVNVRRAASWALMEIACRVKTPPIQLLPALIERLSDPDERVRAICGNALDSLDKAAVPELRRMLRSTDPKLQAEAARVLALMAATGKRHPEAIPDLKPLVKSPDAQVRRYAAHALGKLDSPP